MSVGCFHSLKLSQFRHAVDDLHGRVSIGHGRVLITRDDCDDACVLISKAELEALEHALDVLARSDDYRAMCATLSHVAGECLSVPCHAPCPQTT
jgi:PHD/YefM family antitoxin component YafN of YafNO toxin-antitoxin module